MKKLLLISLLFPLIGLSQTIYLNPSCKTNCNKCLKEDEPNKVTYKVDLKRNIIFRTFDGNPSILSDCTIIDEKNWVCQPKDLMGFDTEYGKQFAVDGVAHWNDSNSMPEFDKKYGYRYSCRYEKNIFGSYKVLKEIRKY